MSELARELACVLRLSPRGASRFIARPFRADAADRGMAGHFSDRAIIQTAHRQGPCVSLLRTWLRQRARERAIRRRDIQFRTTDDGSVRSAYGAMRIDEFADINSLQAWANWRTIPRNLRAVACNRPLRVLDLCCGLGQSTEVLAFYLPPGSEILGLDGNPHFVGAAAGRLYFHRNGGTVKSSFRAQSVLDTFCAESGRVVAGNSIDLIHAVGAIGSHFRPEATAALVAECARVTAPGGAALLDAGREGTPPAVLRKIMDACGFDYVQQARSCRLDRHWQLCFRKRRAS